MPLLIDDPLAQRFFTAGEGTGGEIKAIPADFVVEELPLYDPCGEGEHLFLGIEKENVSHGELMSCLRQTFGIPEHAIGYAGMKDKLALTTQTVSLHMHHDPPSLDLGHVRIRVLWAKRHRNKIRQGHLRGNRFAIRIRGVDPARAPRAANVLDELSRTGAPAWFGPQRFGYRRNNHVLGRHLILGEWSAFLGELLGATGSPFPEYQHERRALFDERRFADAAPFWSVADRAERIACNLLAKGRGPRDAVVGIGRITLAFLASSLPSAGFNRVVDARVASGTLRELAAGDVAFRHDSRGSFLVTDEIVAEGALGPRLAAFAISPSGPMWGRGLLRAAGQVARVEDEALLAMGVDLDTLTHSRFCPEGTRRPLRVPVTNISVEESVSQRAEGDAEPSILVRFDLPRGSYATVVLREIMKQPDNVGA